MADPTKQVVAYSRLVRQVELLASWVILPWDMSAAEIFQRLRSERVRIGTQDLKIASIALAHDAKLLTRNVQDFGRVPGLRFENWLD
jgi:tRNA(fMet)-specific endonuclease VapC